MRATTISGHRVEGKWIGTRRNAGCRARLFDVHIDGVRVSDSPVTRSQVRGEARASIAARPAAIRMRRSARGHWTGRTSTGRRVALHRSIIPASWAGRKRLVCWSPMVGNQIDDLYSSRAAAARALVAWLKKVA
jgi:hypothetical protein